VHDELLTLYDGAGGLNASINGQQFFYLITALIQKAMLAAKNKCVGC